MDCYYEDQTILDFILELSTWVDVDEETKTLALNSDITKWNNKEFRTLLLDYESGLYDEDITILYQRVKDLLK